VKGLHLDVYKHGKYDSTNGGLSGKVTSITVVNLGPDSEVFDVTPDAPAFKLVINSYNTLKLVPVGDPRAEECIGPMFGGNYAATSDSRFSRACEKLLGHSFYGAVPIHDRFETQRQYNALSD
jgi:hypothetical protein